MPRIAWGFQSIRPSQKVKIPQDSGDLELSIISSSTAHVSLCSSFTSPNFSFHPGQCSQIAAPGIPTALTWGTFRNANSQVLWLPRLNTSESLANKKNLFIYLLFSAALYHCSMGAFSGCGKPGLLSRCGAQASSCSGFSCCWARTLKHTGSVVAALGL